MPLRTLQHLRIRNCHQTTNCFFLWQLNLNARALKAPQRSNPLMVPVHNCITVLLGLLCIRMWLRHKHLENHSCGLVVLSGLNILHLMLVSNTTSPPPPLPPPSHPGKESQRPVAHECLGEVLRVLRQVINTYPLLNTVEILTAAGKLISKVKGQLVQENPQTWTRKKTDKHTSYQLFFCNYTDLRTQHCELYKL